MKPIGDRERDRHDDLVPARRRDLRGDASSPPQTLVQRLRETAFLTRGLRISLTDERAGGEQVEFHYEGGIKDFVAYINESKDPVHRHIVYFENENDAGLVEVAMQWNTSYQESVFSFANNINTHRGRHPHAGLPLGADAHAEQVRARQGPAEGEGGQPRGRGRARGPRRRHLREAPEPAVRGPDEDEARQPADRRPRRVDGQRRSSRSSSRRTRPTRARSSTRRSPRRAPAWPPARRAS